VGRYLPGMPKGENKIGRGKKIKRSEARIQLAYFEARLDWLKEQININRNLYIRYLTKANPKEISPEKAHFSLTYIDFIRWKNEELILQKEIKKLKKKLGIEEGRTND
jgi:hypothetical protein